MFYKVLLGAVLAFTYTVTLAAPAQRSPFSTDKCLEYFPFGFPKSGNTDSAFICREGYALEYDRQAKIPTWVSYTLTPGKALGCSKRATNFQIDNSIGKKFSPALSDYHHSGYDIGHLANSADMRWNDEVSAESNILSNTAPQKASLNRGAWKVLEDRIRTYVVESGDTVLIYVGTIKTYGPKTLGKNKVVIPEKFFKVVINLDKNVIVSFVYPQKTTHNDPNKFITSIQDVMSQAKVFLPTNENAAQLQKFPVTIKKSSNSDRKDACSW